MAYTGIGATSNTTWALFKEQVDDTIIKALQPKIIYPLIKYWVSIIVKMDIIQMIV